MRKCSESNRQSFWISIQGQLGRMKTDIFAKINVSQVSAYRPNRCVHFTGISRTKDQSKQLQQKKKS